MYPPAGKEQQHYYVERRNANRYHAAIRYDRNLPYHKREICDTDFQRGRDYLPIIPDVEEGEAPHAPLTQALQTKLREGAFEGRRKAVEKQKSDERMIWPLMWKLVSSASQSKVREDPDFEDAFLHLDCIRLWDFIRRSHLTHIFGNGDPMREVNIGEQESRYAALKQGDREYLSTFKTRLDSQIQAGEGAGVAEVTESKRAIGFISKLDPRRYGNMSSKMRNDALRNVPDAYPTTSAAAYRVASGWLTSMEPLLQQLAKLPKNLCL